MAYHHTKFVSCPRCGKTTIEGVGKCYHCGGPIGGTPPVFEYETNETPVYTPFDAPVKAPRGRGGFKKAVLGGVAALTVAFGGVGLFGGGEEPVPTIPDPVPEIVITAPEVDLPEQEPTPEPEQMQASDPAPVPSPVAPPEEQVPVQDQNPEEPPSEETPVNQPAADPTPIAPSEVPNAVYVGSDDSNRYHNPGCRWVKEINDENLVSFVSTEDAKSKGYIPCGTCKPK